MSEQKTKQLRKDSHWWKGLESTAKEALEKGVITQEELDYLGNLPMGSEGLDEVGREIQLAIVQIDNPTATLDEMG